MGLLDSFLGFFSGDSAGSSAGGGILNSGLSMLNAGLDSLGLSQHGRDQYFTRELQRELMERQIGVQQEENQKNRDFSKEMLELNYDKLLQNYPSLLKMNSDEQFNLWRNQFNTQKEYNEQVNSPGGQVARMMAAGLNPTQGVTTQISSNMGGSSVSPPPTINGSPIGGSVSPIGLPQGMSAHGTELSEIGSFIRDLAQAKRTGKETDWYDEFMRLKLDNISSETARNVILTSYEEIQRDILKAYGNKKAAQEYLNLVQQGANLATEGKLSEAKIKFTEAQETLAKSENDKIQKELPYLNERFQKINDSLDTEIELNEEKKRTEKSEQAKNFSIAGLNNALSKTENDLREGKVYGQSLANDLSYIQKEIGSIDVLVADSTWQYKVVELAQRAEQAQLITKQELERLEQLKVQTDWAARQEFAKYCKVFIDGITGAINSYANVKGALNGQQRNDIRQQTVDYMREHEHEVHETVTTNGHDSRGNKVTHTVSRYRAPWQQ